MMWMKFSIAIATVALGLALGAGPVAAEPLVSVTDSGLEPGLVQSWTGDGREVELTLRNGADPLQVAAAIENAVSGVKAKVRAGKVVVRGKSLEELMPLLADIDVSQDDALASLAQLEVGQENFGSGSSLRAKKKKVVAEAFSDRSKVVYARVVAVEPLQFPQVKLTVQVLSSPTGEMSKEVYKGRKIEVRPAFQTKEGTIDWGSDVNQLNLVAYYLEPKDRVQLRLDAKTEDGVYVAGAVAR